MKTFVRMMQFIRPYKLRHFISILASMLEGISYLLMPYAFKVFIDEALVKKDPKLVFQSLSVYFVVVMLAVLFGILKVIVTNLTVQKIIKDTRMNLFRSIRLSELKNLENYKTGSLMSYFITDCAQLSNGLGSAVTGFFQNILRIVTGIIVLGSINYKILILMLVFLPFYLLDILLFSKPIKKSTTKMHNQQSIISESIQESLSGSAEILVLNKQKWEFKLLEKKLNHYIKHSFITSLWSTLSNNLGFLIYWLVHIGVFYIGSRYVINGEMTIGTLIMYGTFMDNIYMPCKLLIQDNINIQKSIASGERYFQLLDSLHSESAADDTSTNLSKFNKSIIFNNVQFSYANDKIFTDFNLEIKKGETVAIIGESGSGKTTLLKLLLNFYQAQKGEINIDGININNLNKESIYNSMSVVFQDVFLFDGSIEDNLLLSNSNVDHSRVEEAAKLAGAHDFIMQLEDGYQTKVGERGSKLSGGQKQRIAIARALLRDSEIYLFDEPTSALDYDNKSILMDTISLLKSFGKTVIIVTHDLTHLNKMDHIVEMSKNNNRIYDCEKSDIG